MKRNPRRWIWAFVVVEALGLAVDALWHGLVHGDFEAKTAAEMMRHLATVHLPLYIGVLGLLVSTTWAVFASARRAKIGLALPSALVGAVVQTIGEAWHAYSHLELRPNPIPELVGLIGLLAVIIAMLASRRAGDGSPARAAVSNRPYER